jgi:hypothetical protein
MSRKKLFLVETISMFRHRYVVKAKEESHALDEVVMNVGSDYKDCFEEFSQYHIDEVISSSRPISKEEYFELFDKDNNYLKNWNEKQKLRFINVIDYEEDNHGDNQENDKSLD